MNTAQEYATALYQAYISKDQKDFDVFLNNMLDLISERSHNNMILQIISEYEQLSERGGTGRVVVVVAKQEDAEKHKTVIESHADVFGKEYQVVVDENIVGGYVIRSNSEQIDQSFRTRLLEMYQDLVK